jgi:hypothetical protein
LWARHLCRLIICKQPLVTGQLYRLAAVAELGLPGNSPAARPMHEGDVHSGPQLSMALSLA